MIKAIIASIFILSTIGSPVAADEKARPGLFIRSGEAWIFRVANGQPVDVRPARETDEPGVGEIRAELSHSQGASLVVFNRGPEAWQYQAFITGDAGASGQRTSVCTLLPDVASFETWPKGLPGIRVANFQPIDPAGQDLSCT